MPDDRNNDPVQSDFDDWLADEEAAPTDPTAPVAEESADAVEIVDEVDVADDLPDNDATDEFEETFVPPDDAPIEMDAIVANDEDVAIEGDTPDEALGAVAIDPEVDWDSYDESTGGGIAVPDVEPMDAVDEPVFDTGEIAAADDPVVEFDAFDGGHEPITGEMEIIAPEPTDTEVDAGVFDAESEPVFESDDRGDEDDSVIDLTTGDAIVSSADPEMDPPFDFGHVDPSEQFDPFEDTGEAVFVTGESPIVGQPAGSAVAGSSLAGASFAELWGVEEFSPDSPEPPTAERSDAADEPAPTDAVPEDDEFRLATDDFHRGKTREHAGLAEAIAAAETEETEQVALVAAIPGLESSVVGFEDVVEAEGHRRVRARGSGDLVARVITGLVLVVALAASLVWRPALLLLAMAVFVLGAGEFYTALVRHDRKPIALFGFIGIIAACLGAFFWSAAAIPMAFVVAVVLLLLFYAVTPGRPDPMGNLALTTTVMAWAGLGSFAMLIARSDDYRTLIVGVVVTVAAADIAAFFVGRSIGRTHFAPWVSPKKTVEGLVAGVIVAFGLGAVLHFFPPFELTSGLAVGAAAAILTPLGDLAMSAAKRMLGLKDMGSVLPGHGGFLDRIDGLLFVIPAAWAIFVWAGLL